MRQSGSKAIHAHLGLARGTRLDSCRAALRAWDRSRSARPGALGCGLLALLALFGCQGEEPPPENAEPLVGESLDREIDRLRSLGYVDASSEPSKPGESGVVRIDEQRWSPGFTLYNSRSIGHAELLDLSGAVLRRWEQPDGRGWDDTELLPNGDLLVVGSDLVDTRVTPIVDDARFVMRLAWDGRVLWKLKLFAHHDIHRGIDGLFFTLVHKYQRIPGLGRNLDARVDWLTMLSADGRVLEEKSLYDALRSSPREFQFKLVGALTPESDHWDPLHANSVEWLHDEQLAQRDPIYAKGNVLVGVRHQDVIAIINWKRNKLLWAWGPGEIQGPHAAQVLENGNILLFDNGLWRKWSRVIELDPLTKQIVWEYRAENPQDFYTRSGGGCQRLPNGNTLITDSDDGRAFEVTREGDVVWEFFNLKRTLEGRRLNVSDMRRYPPDYVEAVLDQQR